jgi:hypothetical protein
MLTGGHDIRHGRVGYDVILRALTARVLARGGDPTIQGFRDTTGERRHSRGRIH